MRRLAALLFAVTTLGCQPQGPRHPELAGRPLYPSCNQSGDATDANYAYANGTLLAAGTPPRVVKDSETDVWLASPTVVDRVHFVAGKIAAIERGAAPVQ